MNAAAQRRPAQAASVQTPDSRVGVSGAIEVTGYTDPAYSKKDIPAPEHAHYNEPPIIVRRPRRARPRNGSTAPRLCVVVTLLLVFVILLGFIVFGSGNTTVTIGLDVDPVVVTAAIDEQHNVDLSAPAGSVTLAQGVYNHLVSPNFKTLLHRVSREAKLSVEEAEHVIETLGRNGYRKVDDLREVSAEDWASMELSSSVFSRLEAAKLVWTADLHAKHVNDAVVPRDEMRKIRNDGDTQRLDERKDRHIEDGKVVGRTDAQIVPQKAKDGQEKKNNNKNNNKNNKSKKKDDNQAKTKKKAEVQERTITVADPDSEGRICFNTQMRLGADKQVETFCYDDPSTSKKNPCFEVAGRGVRCLPYFMIIGWPKSGTSALYHFLENHPQLKIPQRKETDFFSSWFPQGKQHVGNYITVFPRVQDMEYTFEASTEYSFFLDAPVEIAKILPKEKIVVMLRNPIDMFRSYTKMKFGKMDFQKMLDQHTVQRCGIVEPGCAENWEQRCTLSEKFACRFVGRAIYHHWLEHWFSYFPRDQILIETTDELWDDPSAVLGRIETFLGLKSHDFGAVLNDAVNVGGRGDIYDVQKKSIGKLRGVSMTPEQREYLRSIYAPHVRSLEKLLGRKFPEWDL